MLFLHYINDIYIKGIYLMVMVGDIPPYMVEMAV